MSAPSFDSGDENYDNLLNYGFYTNPSTTSEITFSDLTVGLDYFVQLWIGPWDASYPTSFSAGNTVAMNNALGLSRWVTGVFTADATTQMVSYYGSAGSYGVGSALALSSISAVPEPTTYAAFGGLAVLGLAIWGRTRLRDRSKSSPL